MASTDLKNKNVNIYIDDQAAEDSLQRLQKAADGFNKKIDDTRSKQKQLTDEIAKAKASGKSYTNLEKDLKKVNAELAKNEKQVKDNTAAQKKLQDQIASGTGSSMRQQQALVSRLTNEYKNLAQGTAEAEAKLKQLGEASRNLDLMRDRLNNVTRAQNATAKSSNFLASFFGNVVATVAIKAAAAVSDFFNGAIEEATEAEEATARLKNTLDNLGRSDVFDRMVSKAEEMAAKFQYLDNDDVLGVFKNLIDYGKLSEKQMNDLLPVIIDFAANSRVSLSEASTVIIKALEGSAKGLKQYGIDVKDAKTETERLEIIMTTLAQKVDGAGEAFQDSAAGGIATAKQEFKNLKEEIGTGLLPMLNTLLSFTVKAINNLKSFGRAVAAQLRGNSGFIQIALDEVESNPELKKAVVDMADDQVRSIVNLQKEVEKKIGRSLDVKNKEDAKLLKDVQEKGVQGIENSLKADQERLAQLITSGKRDDQQEARSLKIAVLARTDAINQLKELLNPNTATIGISQPTGTDDKAAEDAKKKREEELRKIAEFIKKVEKLYADAKISTLPAIDKDIAELDQKFNEYRKQANELIKDEQLRGQQLMILEEAYQIGRAQIILKYGNIAKDQYEKINAEIIKKQDDQFKKSIQLLKDHQQQLVNDTINGAAQSNENRDAQRRSRLELQVLKSNGLKKLKAQKDLLDEQQRQEEIALMQRAERENLTTTQIETEKALIEEQYRQAKMERELQFWTNFLSQTIAIVQSIVDIFGQAKEDAELARLQRTNDKKKSSDQKLLNNRLISQQEFNRRSKALDDQYDKLAAENKKKQFERQQKADVAAAKIKGAQAVLSALSTSPFVLGLVLAGIATIKTLKEINAIKNEPVPEFAKGTLLNGPSHSNGGIDMINSKTGKKVAEAEGGEALLSKKTVQNNPDLVGALLHASMYRNGENIQPAFRTRPYVGVDYAGIIESSRKMKYFESGGVLADTITNTNNTTQQAPVAVPAMTPEQEALFQAVLRRLETPSKSYVIFSEIQDANDQLNKILDDAIFK